MIINDWGRLQGFTIVINLKFIEKKTKIDFVKIKCA